MALTPEKAEHMAPLPLEEVVEMGPTVPGNMRWRLGVIAKEGKEGSSSLHLAS
jgi:hypothetical protein